MPSKHLLLAVSGMTPQIVTETLYAIHKKSPEKMPTEVIVLTTETGSNRIKEALMGEDNHLDQFCVDYRYPPIKLEIRMPTLNGFTLADVRTDAEQEATADFITEQVRRLTQDDSVAIHASLAGGRKTMGFTLGYAMSLFGRPQDCLSHVLVNEPYDQVPDFFYPTPATSYRFDRDKNNRLDLSKAEVTLGEIPLVLMREGLPNDLIAKENTSYTQVVKHANQANALNMETVSVTLAKDELTIYCNGLPIKLSGEQFAFYAWMARDTKDAFEEGIEPVNDDMSVQELTNRLRSWIISSLTESNGVDYTLFALPDLIEEADFPAFKLNNFTLKIFGYKAQAIELPNGKKHVEYAFEPDQLDMVKKQKTLWSRLLKDTNIAIQVALGKKLAEHYIIKTVNKIKKDGSDKRPIECKGLKILPENIHFVE